MNEENRIKSIEILQNAAKDLEQENKIIAGFLYGLCGALTSGNEELINRVVSYGRQEFSAELKRLQMLISESLN